MKTRHARGAVLITGASSGIGRATALHLDKIGFKVFAGVRKKEDATNLQRSASERLIPVIFDITDYDSIVLAKHVIQENVKQEGLKGLVNNAGVAVAAPLELMPLKDFREQFEINIIGQIAVIQVFIPLLRQGKGRIVNIGSDSGRASVPLLGAYCASKFALEAITTSLRMELKPWNITVSIIEPGSVETPLWDKSKQASEAIEKAFLDDATKLYGTMISKLRHAAEKSRSNAISPSIVVKHIEKALSDKKPKYRYVIGADARAIEFLRLLPEKLRDFIVIKILRV